ncbi:hypothetical protein B0E55_06103 [Rhodococcus sp. 66b]|nr:hypothetical protein B0E55_06103 [Rhodococcus sp. 66b]
MLPIIHPHPPNRKTIRKHKTPKHSPLQQHSTLTKTPSCTTRETNPTPTEYRNLLTCNNIQNTQNEPHNTSHPTRHHSPTPTKPEHPTATQKRRRPTHPQQPPRGHVITAVQRYKPRKPDGTDQSENTTKQVNQRENTHHLQDDTKHSPGPLHGSRPKCRRSSSRQVASDRAVGRGGGKDIVGANH